MIEVPIHSRDAVVAHTLVDDVDEAVALSRRWCLAEGYAAGGDGRRGLRVFLHRLVLGLTHGDGLVADHLNCDRLDNRRNNLRVLTLAQNAQNRDATSGNGRSSYRGVQWRPRERKWIAVTYEGRRARQHGSFDTELEAALAAEEARLETFPFSVPQLTVPVVDEQPGQHPTNLTADAGQGSPVRAPRLFERGHLPAPTNFNNEEIPDVR